MKFKRLPVDMTSKFANLFGRGNFKISPQIVDMHSLGSKSYKILGIVGSIWDTDLGEVTPRA